ncbi:MAG: DUF3883 domain-containing protein [Holophagaceae bacterium]|nr:DUF3883 domain-containing protein [Holophagaceae bacterium]
MGKSNKHENYEILNLIGYGLSKFDKEFVSVFGHKTKVSLYQFFVDIGIAQTIDTIKNRQDIFDGLNPYTTRKGWWQKGDAYKHRKEYVDSMFGELNVFEYADVVKMFINELFKDKPLPETIKIKTSPVIRSIFKQMQHTGIEAEHFFLNNYKNIEIFKMAIITDARLFGDGYDFQLSINEDYYLAEVKGIREKGGSIRFTKNEYEKAREYSNNYALVIVSNLAQAPRMTHVLNPLDEISFTPQKIITEQIYYQSAKCEW